MNRISSQLTQNSVMNNALNRQAEMDRLQNQISSQNKLQRLRDDPAAAGHATRYASYINRLDRYSENLEYGIDNYRITEGHMQHAVDILQQIREIAVQGANGTYTAEDRQYMARRVDELLGGLLETANAKNGDGSSVFAGDRTRSTPFRVVEGTIPNHGGTVVAGVEYAGSIGLKMTETSEGNYMPLNFPGNRVFWAENQSIYSGVDASNFVVREDSEISIDGTRIPVKAGDNIYTVIASINRSDAPVKARLDVSQNSLVLEGTTPHQIWLEDINGTVLSDIGVLSNNQAPPPNNAHPDARVFGGSVFDAVIRLRNELYAGDSIDIGGGALGGIDTAMNNLLSELGSIGAKTERMEFTYRRLSKETLDMTNRLSDVTDVDLTETITRLKMYETTHQAALAALARIVPQTLLNFLR